MSKAVKPVTEYVNKRQGNAMFHSGYIARPVSGAGRFGNVTNTTTTTNEIQESQVLERGTGPSLRPSMAGPGGFMEQSGYMSTSMYMGNVIFNRLNKPAAPQPGPLRQNNVMYHSQTVKTVGVDNKFSNRAFKQDMKLFTVPPKVQQFLDNAHNEINYVARDVTEEKAKMNAELDSIAATLLSIVEAKRAELNGLYDGYMAGFVRNIEETKTKVVGFKNTNDWMKMQNSENGDRLVRLTSIGYLHTDPRTGLIVEHKREAHKNICELRNLKQEVAKNNLEFYVAELQRMGLHYPMFANTSSSAEYLSEMKTRLFKSTETGMQEFGNLAFGSKHVDFATMLCQPRIFTSLGESRLNCLTNMADMSGNSIITSRVAQLSHEQPVTTIMNIDDDSFATGDLEGTINVFNHILGKETHKFKMRGITPVTALGRIRTTYDLVGGGEAMVSDQTDRTEKHDKNIFLISGHSQPEPVISIWDLKKQVFVTQLKGHTDDVTAIASLQDGHTLITGSKSGATIVYNLAMKKPLKIMQNLVNAPVNCLYTFNDLSRFAIGYDNGEVQICQIFYEAAAHEKNAVCSNCEMTIYLKSPSPVMSINESHTNPNTLITGHQDGVVRIWNIANQTLIKDIKVNNTPVVCTLVVENPFVPNLDENYHIISCGETQDDIFFNLPRLGKNYQLPFPVSINHQGSKWRNPKIQLYRQGKEEDSNDSVHIATFKNVMNMPSEIVFIDIK